MISGYQLSYSYLTYSLNFNTDNYEFFINSFNSTFFTILYSVNFLFIYPQNPQAYQYSQTGNEKQQSSAFLMLLERKAIKPPLNQGN